MGFQTCHVEFESLGSMGAEVSVKITVTSEERLCKYYEKLSIAPSLPAGKTSLVSSVSTLLRKAVTSEPE